MAETVLFVDDEPLVTEGLKRALHKEPYDIICANSAREALDILERRQVAVVISDEQMPGMGGADLLSTVKLKYPDTIRMMLTGHASLESTIRAINDGGIYRFFTKPCDEADLSVTIRQALQQRELVMKAQLLLSASKRQTLTLEKLQQEHPEIVKLERDASGAIVLDESAESTDIDKLLEEITKQTKRIM